MGSVPPRFTGPAGEHYVVYRLHAQGLMAALAPRNAPTVDVLVRSPQERVVAEVQVKTSSERLASGWQLDAKDEDRARPGLFYALVNINRPERPATFILPSGVVADVVRKEHAAWLVAPKLSGDLSTEKVDNRKRSVRDKWRSHQVPSYPDGWMEPYREAWNLLRDAMN